GSRIARHPDERIAQRLGVRIITMDRPGSGLSDFQPGRRILDWPADVAALADHLGMGSFAVAGISGGGPYALACAYAMPDRVTAAGSISGVAPFDFPEATEGMNPMNRFMFGMARRLPWQANHLIGWAMSSALKGDRSKYAQQMLKSFPKPDQEAMQRLGIEAMVLDSAEAFRQGVRGNSWETALVSRPWGFSVAEIRVPVHLWQGDADANVPLGMGRWLATNIPGCQARFCPGEGHLLFVDHWEEILMALV
ncbi:MAG TPA: alpha/beta hydrolase, partial [Symbiobacteriaceae bacterium]|nr:alpha/beta hydrolase [Symbiobacteriaceae bacterium]